VVTVKRGVDAFNHRNVDTLTMLVTHDFELVPAMMGITREVAECRAALAAISG
jgi:hypothetical protein